MPTNTDRLRSAHPDLDALNALGMHRDLGGCPACRPADLATLYPDGRTFYDETGDSEAFIAACHAMGLCPATNYPPPEQGLDPFTTVYVPPKKLDDFYALDLAVGT